jgi:DNA-binding NarL/FixJ family response regulator
LANIVLSGLEVAAESDLRRLLNEQGHRVSADREAGLATADVLFCNADDPGHLTVVRRIRARHPNLRVVVVTGNPDSSKWLDALEAGASNYCSAPFETAQICWLLSAVLSHQAAAGNQKPW